jgi:RHS repeat-associated protein
MDSLFYSYTQGTNRLSEVDDKSDGLENYTDDFTGTHSYTYDADGNLSSDLAEKIKAITWNSRGKIDTIYKIDNSIICFRYDPLGNRIAKIIRSTGGVVNVKDVETYYVYDPQGLQLATYTKHYSIDNNGKFNTLYTLNEHFLYGSKRYGSDILAIDLAYKIENGSAVVYSIYNSRYSHQVGYRSYEANDHLSNVLATFSDKRIPFINGTGTLSYAANVNSANLYYPFGMQMPGLKYNSDKYRFGYIGKENISEIGNNTLDFSGRYYNSSIGRWFSIDPHSNMLPWLSTYHYSYNNPIYFLDNNGKLAWPISKTGSGDGWNTTAGWFGQQRKTHIHQGVDINKNTGGSTDLGAPVYATHSGTVVAFKLYTDDKDGGGTRVIIQSDDGKIQTVFMHLNSLNIKLNQKISEGDKIGEVGGTGFGKIDGQAVHLHYEIRELNDKKYVAINPETKRGEIFDVQKKFPGEETIKEDVPLQKNNDGFIKRFIIGILDAVDKYGSIGAAITGPDLNNSEPKNNIKK